MYEQVYSLRTSRPSGPGSVATGPPASIWSWSYHFHSEIIILRQPEAGGDDHMQQAARMIIIRLNEMRSPSSYLVIFALVGGEICCSTVFLFFGSLWGDWALARRERRGDPGLCVSAHPAAVTISAWRCLMPARPCQAVLGPLDVETSPAQSPTPISLPSLLFGRKMSQNQIPRQDF